MYLVADDLGGQAHIFHEFVEPAEGADDAAFVGVGHFAESPEVRPVAPLIGHLNQLLLDAVDILVLKL